jgi:hypothetical protein
MQTNRKETSLRVMSRRDSGGNRRERKPVKTGYAAYNGIEDFLRSYPIFSLNEYGERVIGGRRIC